MDRYILSLKWPCFEGQWQKRLWDEETYSRLLEVKQTWDPEHVFHCRHCIGDEEQSIRKNEKTLRANL